MPFDPKVASTRGKKFLGYWLRVMFIASRKSAKVDNLANQVTVDMTHYKLPGSKVDTVSGEVRAGKSEKK